MQMISNFLSYKFTLWTDTENTASVLHT